MNNFVLLFIQELEPGENLRDYQLSFFLRKCSVLFKIEVEIRATAALKHSAEAVMINFYCIKLLHYSSVPEFFVSVVLSNSMLNVIFFDLLTPVIIKVMYLASDFSTILNIKCFINF
jgi:hypothetical protein